MAVTSLSALRARKNSLEDLAKKVEDMTKKSGGKEDDGRFWQCKLDEGKNGSAIIRFLPAPMGEEDSFVRVWSHGFKGPGGWYISECLTTIGQDDPVVEHCNELWESGVEADKAIARERKRKLSYYSNILVISDPANPDNEGKVFLYRYGQKIFDKIADALKPQFDDEEAINVFDVDNGANFRLKVVEKDGYANVDKSSFAKQTPVAKTDEEIERIWKQCHSLQEFIKPEKFKSYDELKARLDKVLGKSSPKPAAKGNDLDEDDVAFLKQAPKEPSKPAKQERPKIDPDDLPDAGKDNDADDLAYFARLASE